MMISTQPSYRQTPPVRDFIPAALMLGSIGWLGLAILIIFTLPTLAPRWLFFFFSVVALTGSFLPGVAFLNIRFATRPPATHNVILREAIWVGIYPPCLAWLQIGRVLTPALAFLLALIILLIELVLRLIERTKWQPEAGGIEPPIQ